MKGFISGVLGWLAMDLIFFPLLGLGPFAAKLGLGFWACPIVGDGSMGPPSLHIFSLQL
jgi:hypothetical protein